MRGDGDAVLRFSKEQWIGLLGDWGEFIYAKVEAQKYVDVSWNSNCFYDYSNSLVI